MDVANVRPTSFNTFRTGIREQSSAYHLARAVSSGRLVVVERQNKPWIKHVSMPYLPLVDQSIYQLRRLCNTYHENI